MKGTFYAVGVGPGDPELITMKAVRILKECSVIVSPKSGSGNQLALEIARQVVDLSGKQILQVDFPMTRNREVLEKAHHTAAQEIAHYLDEGLDAAMVNLGDVSIYATVNYVREILEQQGYAAEMVAGVPSFCAVASRLGISMTAGMQQPVHIIPAGSTELESMLELPGTKILMKSGSSVHKTVDMLEQKGMLDRSALVADCGLPGELVCRDLKQLPEKVSYFATFIVRE